MRILLLACVTALCVIAPIAGVSQAVSAAPPTQFAWPSGKRAAIVLTYDDSLPSQLDTAIPQLDEFHLNGTFFLNAHNITPKDMLRWRATAQKGHELANHTLFHPCPRAMYPHPERYASENYDVTAILDEIAVMNDVLFGIDGRESRTYATTCAQGMVGGADYTDALRRSQLVKYNRDGGDESNSIVRDFPHLDPFHVPSWGFGDHPDGDRLVAYAKNVHEAGGLGVLMFHGVGGDYLEVTADAHKQLLTYLHDHPDIWVGTFQEVMDYVTSHTAAK